MTSITPPQDLVNRAEGLGFTLSEAVATTLLAWRDCLLEEGQRINLTGVRDPEEADSRLILDSLAVLRHVDPASPGIRRVLDLGTGGGVPGVPLAIARPDLDVALVESRQRKCDAVERIVATMGLANARVLRGRLNELLRSHTDLEHGHDLVVCRAVGSLEDVLRTAYPALAPNGVLVMWKSDPLDPDEERAGEARAARLGCERLDDLVHDAYKPSRLVRYRRPGETS